MKRYTEEIRKAHSERYYAEANPWYAAKKAAALLPAAMLMGRSQQQQLHWLLGRNPLAKLETVYPYVWDEDPVERKKLSGSLRWVHKQYPRTGWQRQEGSLRSRLVSNCGPFLD